MNREHTHCWSMEGPPKATSPLFLQQLLSNLFTTALMNQPLRERPGSGSVPVPIPRCPLDDMPLTDAVCLPCGHSCNRRPLQRWIDKLDVPKCPTCMAPVPAHFDATSHPNNHLLCTAVEDNLAMACSMMRTPPGSPTQNQAWTTPPHPPRKGGGGEGSPSFSSSMSSSYEDTSMASTPEERLAHELQECAGAIARSVVTCAMEQLPLFSQMRAYSFPPIHVHVSASVTPQPRPQPQSQFQSAQGPPPTTTATTRRRLFED